MSRELCLDSERGPNLEPSRLPERKLAQEARSPEAQVTAVRSYESQRSRPGWLRPRVLQSRDQLTQPRPRTERTRGSSKAISERYVNLLAEIGRFRIIRATDLRQAFFDGSERNLSEALARLRASGLIEDHVIRRRNGQNGPSAITVRVVALTKAGKRVAASRSKHVLEQRHYAGLVKPREAWHDSNLYPLFRAHTAKLALSGNRVRRVVLDFELKREYLRELRRRERQSPGASEDQLKREAAAQSGLSVIDGKIQFPDLRLECENSPGQRSRVDLELATADYRQGELTAKARVGFTLYAAAGDRGRLGAMPLDDHNLVAGILSF